MLFIFLQVQHTHFVVVGVSQQDPKLTFIKLRRCCFAKTNLCNSFYTTRFYIISWCFRGFTLGISELYGRPCVCVCVCDGDSN